MLVSKLRSLFQPSGKRASPSTIDIVPEQLMYFGKGAYTQTQIPNLLRESVGIPDAACRAIANRLATLNPEVYIERRTRPGTTIDEILDDHPLTLLLRHPHPNLTFSQTFRLVTQYIVTVGEAYLFKVGDRLRTRELHVIPPQQVFPIVESNVIKSYRVVDANGREEFYPPNTFVRMYFPDPENPWQAEGYLYPTGISADAHKFAGQHLRYHYQYDATPKAVLQAEEGAESWTQEELEAFYERWRQAYSSRGGAKAGLPALTPVGYKLVAMAIQSGREVAPLLQYFRDDILLQYGVPKSVLGQVTSGDRSSAETNQWVFDRYAVLPVARLIEESINHQLAPDFDSKIRFRFQTFVSEDKDFLLKQEKQDLELKVRSINMVREDRRLEGTEWGEYPVGQLQDVPYDPDRLPEPGETESETDPTTDSEPATPEEEARAERLVHIKVRQHFARRRKRRKPSVAA